LVSLEENFVIITGKSGKNAILSTLNRRLASTVVFYDSQLTETLALTQLGDRNLANKYAALSVKKYVVLFAKIVLTEDNVVFGVSLNFKSCRHAYENIGFHAFKNLERLQILSQQVLLFFCSATRGLAKHFYKVLKVLNLLDCAFNFFLNTFCKE